MWTTGNDVALQVYVYFEVFLVNLLLIKIDTYNKLARKK